MNMKFCKVCGTIYDPGVGACPKCVERELMESQAQQLAYDENMDPAAAAKAKKRAWVQIVIGVPAMIGLFYLVFYVAKLLMAK